MTLQLVVSSAAAVSDVEVLVNQTPSHSLEKEYIAEAGERPVTDSYWATNTDNMRLSRAYKLAHG